MELHGATAGAMWSHGRTTQNHGRAGLSLSFLGSEACEPTCQHQLLP